MEYQDQLKLQAYLDGELPAAQARAMGERLARDPEAAALAAELRQTCQALAGFEPELQLPETREFFWSKIQRQIQGQHQESPAPQTSSMRDYLVHWRRWFMPALGLAVVGLGAVVLTGRTPPITETSLEDSGAFTYHNYASGTTLVWLSYPAKSDPGDDDWGMPE